MAASAGVVCICGVGTSRNAFIPGPQPLPRGDMVILKLNKEKSAKEFRGGRREGTLSCASASASSIEQTKDNAVTFRPCIDTTTEEPKTVCEACRGLGFRICDYCEGEKVNVPVKGRPNRFHRRCPECRAVGIMMCYRCKVFKCVTFPDWDDGSPEKI